MVRLLSLNLLIGCFMINQKLSFKVIMRGAVDLTGDAVRTWTSSMATFHPDSKRPSSAMIHHHARSTSCLANMASIADGKRRQL